MKYLDVIAWIVLLPAGFIGSVLMMHMLSMNHAPKKISLAYMGLSALGLLLLLIYAFFTENKEKNIDTLVMFLVAVLSGLFLFAQYRKHKMFDKWMIFLCATFSLSGLIWLSIHVLNELK
jgi:lipid-A-disaccharide synthase-like uncharacterized protein